MIMFMMGTAVLCLLAAGCSTQCVYRGFYEGARVKNQLDSPPSERLGKPEPPADYQQYEMIRRELLQKNSQSSP